jgi:hypothetical protein
MIACGPLPMNLEYIDLTHLLYNNFVSNIDKPKKVLGFGEDGDILVERSKYSKVKSVTNMGNGTSYNRHVTDSIIGKCRKSF